MKKLALYFLSVLTIISTLNINIKIAYAAGENKFILNAYNCYEMNEDYACLGPNNNAEEELAELETNADVEPGKIIKLDLYYIPGDITDVQMQIGIKYDKTSVEPIYADGELYVEYDETNTNKGGIWPPAGTTNQTKNKTNWGVSGNDVTNLSMIKLIVADDKNKDELTEEGVLASIYFKVKDTANPGDVITFSFDNEFTKMAKKSPLLTTGITFNVYGQKSNNNALDTLVVKNGTTIYTLSPEFVSGKTDDKEYSTVVPNQITNVDIVATPLDSTSIVTGTGNKTLSVGSNSFDITVTAQNSKVETYQVKIYRLNNDTKLKTLSLSNGVNIGTFDPATSNYAAVVPYSTSTTTITATKNHEFAKIKTDLSQPWSLSNYGSTKNIKEIEVEAENCLPKYSTVPGNICTTGKYKIEVSRTAPSNNADLATLTIDGKSVPDFAAGTITYNLPDVTISTTKVNVQATVAEPGKATIITTLGNKNLSTGDNAITVTVQAEDGTTTKTYTVNIRQLSNDSKLKTLTVTSPEGGTFSPPFSSTVYNYYTFTAPSTATTATIAATLNDPNNATIVSGTGSFNIDENPTVNVIVQAEDGTQSIYVVKLVREKSSNAYLKSLSIDGYSLNETFNKETTLYTANVAGNVSNITINAEVEDTGKATIVSGTGSHNLAVGTNTIQVKVKAENNSTKDYTITVTRAPKSISALTDLTIDGTTVTGFAEGTLEYVITTHLPFNKNQVIIGATKKDPDSTVTGTGTINLSTGDNKLYVTVTAQDGKSKTSYIINLYREKDSNADLEYIKIDSNLITGFNKDTITYSLSVGNSVKSLNLNAKPESNSATVLVSGNSDFKTTKNNPVIITVTAENGTIKTYTINVTREKSDNNYLKSISLSSGLLNPVFNKTTQKYTVDVDRSVTTITITPETEDPTATAVVTGPGSLIIGDNIYNITVTNEKGVDRVYEITVKRNPSNNSYLSNLTIDGTTITGFVKTKESYTISVPSNKESVTIGAQVEESHASTIIRKQGDTTTTSSTSNTFNLSTGVNSYEVVVIAENNSSRTYSIVVNRERSSDNTLSDLSITQTTISPVFSSNTTEYTASVGYNVTSIDIVATKNDSKATVTGDGNKTLNTGDNTFNIVVKAEDNTTKTYTIVVTRAKNDNAHLSNLVISGGFKLTPDFDREKTSYSLTVPNSTKSVTITGYKEDPNAKSITGDGLINLNTGVNNINVVVTAENGTTKMTYKVAITRELSSDTSLKELTVSDGILTPTFNKDDNKPQYEVTVQNEIENLTITAVPTSDAATATVSGNTGLTVGTNTATITVTAEDGTLGYYTIKILRQPSSNNFLSSLSVKDANNVEYIETFLKTKTEYNITVENDVDTVTITGILDDSTSSMTGTGEKTLEIGENEFEILVTSAASISRPYTIKITRQANSNNFLSSLEVVDYQLSPVFNKNTVSYTVNVPSTVSSITINATPEVSSSTVTGTGEQTLSTGVNNFNIDVTSEDTSVKTYVIVVNKAASSDNYLSNLAISPGTLEPSFNKEINSYTVHVDNSTTLLTITADPEHPAATVTGDGLKALSVGTQKFDIVVTAENNSPRTYEVTVTRDASSNKDLSDLTVDGTTVTGFNKDILEYSMNVDNDVTSITVGTTVVDTTASVSGDGIINLNTGLNDINITVTAEDGTFKVYKLKVTRAKSSNNYLSKLHVAEGTLSPEFNKETSSYTITVPYESTSLTIDAKPEDNTAKIEIDSNNNFVVGTNKVMVNVVAEDETVRPYEIIVTRQPQSNNFLTNITVSSEDGTKYSLSPAFDKYEYLYDVYIPSTISSVDINVTKEASSLIVEGDGNVPITSLPQEHKVIVKTTGGLERTYTINLKKDLSSNIKLANITLSQGNLSPAFNSEEDVYLVKLPSGTKSVTVTAVKAEEEQIVTGDGLINLKPGDNRVNILVTSENGNTKIYKIIIDVGPDNENVLTSLTVDKGTLTPEFDKDVKYYTVELEDTEEDITISATGNNTITGIGTFELSQGPNIFEVKSIDTEEIENTYTVVVYRGNINSKYLALLKVENHTLNEEFNKENTNYSLTLTNLETELEVIAIPENQNATVEITGNTDLKIGDNIINIKVTDPVEGELIYTINVSIGQNKITSNIHTVGDTYIQTIKELTSAQTVKDEMLNPNEYLKIYNLDGTEISDSDNVATGYTIKLIIDGTVYDSKILIIKGDLNSNGEVEVGDVLLLKRHVLETVTLKDYQIVAADVNNDDDSGIADLLLIKRHVLETINIFN